jgi:hypothetical protein
MKLTEARIIHYILFLHRIPMTKQIKHHGTLSQSFSQHEAVIALKQSKTANVCIADL